jgi:formylglycine-generating enzyme required for sulfatase activity
MKNLSTFAFETITVDIQGKEIARESTQGEQYLENLDNGGVLEMVALPGGSFLMGCPESETGWHRSQSPQHLVTLEPFFISKYPITQAQWQALMGRNPANFVDALRPVEQVSWYEAQEFCQNLTQTTGKDYHLPTEAQWEYACRAHTLTPFHFGDSVTTDIANYSGVNWEYLGKICNQGSYGLAPLGEDRRETTPVGNFAVANGFGLYDCHGNVREWCEDVWHPNYDLSPKDGSAWIVGGEEGKRVLRGGSWNGGPKKCRSAYRVKFAAEASLYDVGFRVVCSTISG